MATVSWSGTLCLAASFAYGLVAAIGQAPQREGLVQLRDVAHFGSEALICNGVSPVVMESNSFLIQLVGGGQLGNVVHRIALDGSSDTKFDVTSIRRPFELGDRTPYVSAFASSRGEVYVLTRWFKNRVSDINNIVAFDPGGAFERIIPLGIDDLQVLHMAGFGGGGFALLAGRNGESGFRSVEMIILDGDGRIRLEKPLRELSASEEELAKSQAMREAETAKAETKAKQNAIEKSTAASPNEIQGISQVEIDATSQDQHPGKEMDSLFFRTLLVPGEDGAVYLVRPDKLGIIYRVTSDGNTTTIPLKNAEERTASTKGYTELTNGTVSRGQLILFYSEMDSAPSQFKSRRLLSLLIKSYRLFDGEPTGTYVGNSQMIGSTPAGWNGNGPSYLKYVKSAQPPGFEIVASSR